MARPLRYEAPGAIYNVMARGDGGRDILESDFDCQGGLKRLEEACGSFGWRVHAWELMGNHFHLLLETPEPNLVKGMKWWFGMFCPRSARAMRLGRTSSGTPVRLAA